MTEDRWRELTAWPLLVASLVFIVAYSWQVIAELSGTARTVAVSCMAVAWLFFLFDYLARLLLAKERGHWFVHHIPVFLTVFVPAFRPLTLLRALTEVRALRVSRGTEVRTSLSIYGGGAAVILLWMGSVAVLHAERGQPGALIETMGDAVWWSFVTITTTGYGDMYPVTFWGRVIGVLMMCGGVAIVGVVTATLASWVIEKAGHATDDDKAATRGEVRAVAREIETLLGGRDAGSPPVAGPKDDAG